MKFPTIPGVYKDDSPLKAKGYWIDADKIRFVRGLPETIYGWERASSATLLGICRGALTWADNGRNPFAAFGTHLRLYVMDVDGNITDITPVISRGSLSNPFDTTSGSTTVTVNHTAHGLVENQKVKFTNASAGGGITISGEYVVNASPATNSYTITHSAAATSTVSGTGGTAVRYDYFLAPGQTDGLGGLGYGVGGFGTGGFGSSASGYALYPRSWSFASWGQNLIANPRGGGIYEWAPNVTASELVTNGDMGSATGWTAGAGWTIGAGVATATAGSASDLSTSVTLPVAAWCLLQFDYTRTAGALQPKLGSTALGSALNSASGHPFLVFFSGGGGAQNIVFSKDATFAGTVDNVSVKVLTSATPISGAPTAVTCIFTTAERVLVACGCADSDGNFDAMRLRWSGQEDNQDWSEAPPSVSGNRTLTNGSRIVRGLPGTRENVILTDTALHAMRFSPDVNVVYDIEEIGSGCGLLGPNAVAQVAGRFFWITPGIEFYTYEGGYPQPLQCTLSRDVRDNLARVQQDKVYAFPVAARNEVWWLYPDSREGNECSRYVIYNFVEDHWSCGTFDRTAWVDAGAFTFPLAVDTAGRIWFQEKDFTQDGGVRTWSLSSAYFDLGDGEGHMRLNAIQPDSEDLRGGYSITITTRIRNNSGIIERDFGPYSVNAATGKVSPRANGQEAKFTLAGSGAPAFWRMGAWRVDVEPTGRKR
jgi:hypothetical protein